MPAHFFAHTPIELALLIFEAFSHIYMTRYEQISFSRDCTPAELLLDYTIHSRNACFVLAAIYKLFEPLVCRDSSQTQMLQAAFLYATNLIHAKFGTSQHC
jgi:hypothetical protein